MSTDRSAIPQPINSRFSHLPNWLPLLVAGIGIALSLFIWWKLREDANQLVRTQFGSEADERVETIRRRFEENLGVVYALMAFYEGSEAVEPDEFQDFTRPLLQLYDNVETLIWLPRVTNEGLDAHIAEAKVTFPTYLVRWRDATGKSIPAGNRAVYYPINYVASIESERERLLGFDWGSEPVALASLDAAAKSGQVNVSGAIPWRDGGKEGIHVLVFAPVYLKDVSRRTEADRQAALHGLVGCRLDVADLVGDAISLLTKLGIDIYLVDTAGGGEPQRLHVHQDSGAPRAPVDDPASMVQTGIGHRTQIQLANREWSVFCLPAPEYLAQRRTWVPEWTLVGGLVITALVVGFFVILIRRGRATEELAHELTNITDDLKNALESQTNATRTTEHLASERSLLATDLQESLDTQRRARERIELLVDKIREAMGHLAVAGNEILGSSSQQAGSAQQQADAVRETMATVEEVTQCAHAASEHAKSVSDSAHRSQQVADSGSEAVARSIEAMEDVQKEVEAIANTILSLAEKAEAISEIIETVTDVTERTNLLALNAAIEASRAGEHGKGFTVVANEVKSLAEESKRGTLQINQILHEIRESTNQAVKLTERGSKAVGAAGEVVSEADRTISTLAQTIADSARLGTKIVDSVGEQVTGMTQLSQAIHHIDDATREALVNSKQTEAAAAKLTELGNELKRLVGQDGLAEKIGS